MQLLEIMAKTNSGRICGYHKYLNYREAIRMACEYFTCATVGSVCFWANIDGVIISDVYTVDMQNVLWDIYEGL